MWEGGDELLIINLITTIYLFIMARWYYEIGRPNCASGFEFSAMKSLGIKTARSVFIMHL